MKQLGQLEAVVMQRLWAAERAVSVREVLENLQSERPLAYTTVMTVLDNLHGKGLLTREKQGRAWVYSAAVSREEHTAELLDQVLAQTSDRGAALLQFVGHLSDDDRARLRSALGAGAPGEVQAEPPRTRR